MQKFSWPRSKFTLAHRGSRSFAPENSLPAFKKSFELGVHGIECDVFMDQDGVPVVIHDETVDRTTSGHGLVREHSTKELRLLQVPTLEETLDCLPDRAIINIELKDSKPYDPQALHHSIVQQLKKHLSRIEVIISSFEADLLKPWGSEYPLGLLFETNQKLAIPTGLRPEALHVDHSMIAQVPPGYKIVLWTAQNIQEAKLWLQDERVCGVICEL